MSARKGIYAITDVPCDGGVSPNAYKAQITAEVRLFFPPNTVTEEEVLDALHVAYTDAHSKAEAFFSERGQ